MLLRRIFLTHKSLLAAALGSGCLFTGPLLFTFCLLNSIASTYKASIALPLNTIIKFVLVWMFFATPLYLLGGFIGKSSQTEVQAQSQNNKDELKASLTGVKASRKILKVPRFMCYLPQMALAGIFPFSAICVELSSVVYSLWGYENYTQYKFLFVTFILLLIITALINMALAGIFPFSAICVELSSVVYSLWGYENYTQYKFLFVTFILLLIITALINVGLICCKIVSKDHKWWWSKKMVKFLLIIIIIIIIIICVLICCGSGSLVRSDTENHSYKAGDPVPLYVNKVGPYQNPSESYSYFDLPFCQPDNFKKKNRTLSELLSGDNLIKAPYELEFLVEKRLEIACSKTLTKEEVSQFREAIKRNYYFQMYYDDLPILESIGESYNRGIITDMDNYTFILHTYIQFEILFNKDRVIEIKIQFIPGLGKDITEDKEKCVDFVYNVYWKEVDTAFDKRMEKYLVAPSRCNHIEFNWFAIINTCESLIVAIGILLKLYFHALKKDFSERLHYKELNNNYQHERRWKCILDDVFTLPAHKSLLAAALGSGCLFTGPLLFTFCLLNSIASTYKASIALPLNTIIKFVLVWMFFATPLYLLGGFIGKSSQTEVQAQSQNNKDELKASLTGVKASRKILKVPRFMCYLPQMALAGIFPFSAICVELSSVVYSLWGYENYTQYKFLFVTFILLLIITALINVGLICCKIVSKDHKWWWRYVRFLTTLILLRIHGLHLLCPFLDVW
ncbi:hypothetical protein G4B88_016418 [Cannabis sativa]|uniref:Transmembrane 9 superfamily member n=2 Tax=Cannabis sativa TaxID=3483 RepID=A0A7J6FFR0_CANSA|nr:hypothetical protein G4B88_016418 [Cannabis sativa]